MRKLPIAILAVLALASTQASTAQPPPICPDYCECGCHYGTGVCILPCTTSCNRAPRSIWNASKGAWAAVARPASRRQ